MSQKDQECAKIRDSYTENDIKRTYRQIQQFSGYQQFSGQFSDENFQNQNFPIDKIIRYNKLNEQGKKQIIMLTDQSNKAANIFYEKYMKVLYEAKQENDVIGQKNEQLESVNNFQIVGNKLPTINTHKIQLHQKPHKKKYNIVQPTEKQSQSQKIRNQANMEIYQQQFEQKRLKALQNLKKGDNSRKNFQMQPMIQNINQPSISPMARMNLQDDCDFNHIHVNQLEIINTIKSSSHQQIFQKNNTVSNTMSNTVSNNMSNTACNTEIYQSEQNLEQKNDLNYSNQKDIKQYIYDIVQDQNYKIEKKIKKNKKIKLKIDSKIDKKDLLLNNRIQDYIDFMKKINFSNNLIVNSTVNQPYKVFVGTGNNSSVIKACVKNRWWLHLVDQKDESVHICWTQLRNNEFLELLKPRINNVIEQQDTNGQNSTNIRDDIDIQDISDSDSDNKTFLIHRKSSLHSSVVKPVLIKHRSSTNEHRYLDVSQESYSENEMKDNLYNLKKILNVKDFRKIVQLDSKYPNQDFDKTTQLLKKDTIDIINESYSRKMHNHLENQWHLSNKKALFYNMRSYYEALKENPFKYIPLTFHIQKGTEDEEFKKFLEYFNKRVEDIKEQEKLRKNPEMNKKIKKLRNIWIIKPGEMTNCGRGIQVCQTLEEIMAIISNTSPYYANKQRTWILQQYIDNPLLYCKRKFDIRCYVLMTSINGIQKAYWYQEGYIRTSCKEFSLKNINNKFIHLTNDAVQKHNPDYGKYESGNKVSYNEFQRYLDTQNPDKKLNFFNDCYPQMKQLATDCVRAVYGKIDPVKRENCFEIFGLDFMIDDNNKVWLIEVNTNPCLALSSSLLARIIPNMIENAFRIAIDPIYLPPPYEEWPFQKKQLCADNLLENNKFELIFDELYHGPDLKKILMSQNQLHKEEGEEEQDED